MSPEQMQLAEQIARETDRAKLTELLAELCRTLERSRNTAEQQALPRSFTTPR